MDDRVLIVDDAPHHARFYRDAFADAGFHAVLIRTVDEAVAVLQREHYDLLVVDLCMPPGHTFTDEDSMAGYTTGLCLARYVRKLQPAMKVLVYTSGSDAIVKHWFEGKTWARLIHRPLGAHQILEEGTALLKGAPRLPRMFIAHGHDLEMVQMLKDFVSRDLGLGEPTLLAQQASLGRTIIEQLEEIAVRIDVAFVLLTPDDIAMDTNDSGMQRRARQNVLLELGYFFGLLGRNSGRVILIRKGQVELPSDLAGLRWIDATAGIDEMAANAIRKELAAWLGS